MERSEILSKITEVFRETLENEKLVLNESTQASDVDDWDSLTHIMLVVGIEKNFNIRFTSKEIQSWNNIGAMIDTISTKS